MRSLRSALLKHHVLAVTIGLAGMILRLAVPAGFMPVLHHGQLSLAICSSYGDSAARSAFQAPSPMSGMGHPGEGEPKAGGSCAFSDLALPLIGGVDPIQLVAAARFIIAAPIFSRALLPPGAVWRLRPPPRGPPLLP